jgi:hypothetical protein
MVPASKRTITTYSLPASRRTEIRTPDPQIRSLASALRAIHQGRAMKRPLCPGPLPLAQERGAFLPLNALLVHVLAADHEGRAALLGWQFRLRPLTKNLKEFVWHQARPVVNHVAPCRTIPLAIVRLRPFLGPQRRVDRGVTVEIGIMIILNQRLVTPPSSLVHRRTRQGTCSHQSARWSYASSRQKSAPPCCGLANRASRGPRPR